ncbi:uncharacterized protein AMSG_10508 [Thecamonas trahens ATCC 50062]|uniref:Uncharacterized protein n=1 Tax=Thecamonas trahens ATCC 50062 TaxID=461836 RepID=A0A0L0DQC1_THETB|nr:hypothetical protein AMSG_10508 [Thecamonas trahens ATCC 50062]KNC54509.1 hypothetical protein AMSG_10508 [Thecamonas trahens ATCC 50062]|eukprot:XP_013753662.1 hypothetical protein AMSG_10508 [Thecamonas trahens ATCC 50062]
MIAQATLRTKKSRSKPRPVSAMYALDIDVTASGDSDGDAGAGRVVGAEDVELAEMTSGSTGGGEQGAAWSPEKSGAGMASPQSGSSPSRTDELRRARARADSEAIRTMLAAVDVQSGGSHHFMEMTTSSLLNAAAEEGHIPHYDSVQSLRGRYTPVVIMHWLTRLLGLTRIGAWERAVGMVIFVVGMVLFGAQAYSLFTNFTDLKHGSVVIIAACWTLYNMVSLATFIFRFGNVHAGWLFSTWKAAWKTETDLAKSSWLLTIFLGLLAVTVGSNAIITIVARWSNLSPSAQQVFREMFVFDSDAIQILLTIDHLVATAVFILPIALFVDVMQTLTRRIERLHYSAIVVGRTLPELTMDLKDLAQSFDTVNAAFGPWLGAVFAIELPLIVFCLVSLLDYASLDGLTIFILVIWALMNMVVAAVVALPSARAHSLIHKLEAAIALHLDADSTLVERSDYVFLVTTLNAHNMGIKIAGATNITFTLMSQAVSFIGSFYLLLVGFRTS